MMMLRIFLSVFFGFSAISSAQAANLFSGLNLKGQGEWRDSNGMKGTFDSTMVVARDKVVSTYAIKVPGAGVVETFATDYGMVLKAGESFAVTSNGSEIGTGYCVDQLICHYQANFYGIALEETMVRTSAKTVRRFGSKVLPNGVTVTWDEILK